MLPILLHFQVLLVYRSNVTANISKECSNELMEEISKELLLGDVCLHPLLGVIASDF